MAWLKQLFTRRSIFSELSEEIQQHLAEKTEALMVEGMSREQAERAAKREFGNVTRIEERGREAWMWPLAESLWADIRFAVRQLRKNLGFALTAILTLALGIGSTTAIFSLVNTVLLRPLAFHEPDRLMWLEQQNTSVAGAVPESLSYPDYFDYRAQNRTFSGIASYYGTEVTLGVGDNPQRLTAQTVSANLFQVLGAAPMLGRDFRWEDEQAGHRTVILSYALWQSRFGSAQDIAGRTITMNGHGYNVAGVMPKGFTFPVDVAVAPAVWMSLADDAEGKSPATAQRGFDHLEAIGRLKPGVTVQQAKADLSLIAANLARQYPESNKPDSAALVEPELQHITGDTRPALRILFGAVTLVLLIACANVAGLLLARGSRRTAEFALRAAIGASRGAIVRQLLVESVTLSLCGGAAGAALAFALLRGMVRIMPIDMPRVDHAAIDGYALGFAVAVSVATGLLFGVFPAWRMSRSRPAESLRAGSRSVAGGSGQHRIHNGLVVAQTAIGLVLLISSGLLIRSFTRILNVDPGFSPDHIATARIGAPLEKLNNEQASQFYDRALTRISALPGVQSASAGWPLPMSHSNIGISFQILGSPVAEGDEPSAPLTLVMPGYLQTLKIPLIAGRVFARQDGAKGAPVIIVSQAFAHRYFGATNPIGQHVQADLSDDLFQKPMREVVGVVGDIRRKGLTTDPEPQLYIPYAQGVITNPFLVVRTSGDPALIDDELRATIREMDKSVPVYSVSTLDDYVSKSAAQPRFQTFLLACFAGVALLLAAIGLYGLLSYTVVQRTMEIGLRMALGAQRSAVLGMIVQRGMMLSLIGIGVGLAASFAITQLLSGMLYGIRPTDPFTFAVTTSLLLLVCVAASSIPAYRAAQLDPIQTLREQ